MKGVIGHGPMPFKKSSGLRKIHLGHKMRPDSAGNGNLRIYRGGKKGGRSSKGPLAY